MWQWLRERSLRRDFTIILLAIVVGPLAVTGAWLARSTARAGEDLLRARLDVALVRVADDIATRWARTRGAVLDVGEREPVRRSLAGAAPSAAPVSREPLIDGLREIVIVDSTGTARWRVVDADGEELAAPPLWVSVPIRDRDGSILGRARAALDPKVLTASAAELGVAIGVSSRESGAALVTLPFDPTLATHERFTLGGQPWLSRRRLVAEPPVELIAASPLADFTAPFAAATRRQLAVLGTVVVLALVAATIVTRRTTRALERLARTADAIAEGELGRTAAVESGEAGRLAIALNAMSASLSATMRELAQRQSLAAVGEFAASLSHEVRNPLASIRLDMQRVQEKLDPASPLRAPLARAIGEVDRLNRTVSGALRVARSGQVAIERIDILVPLSAAVAAATPELERHQATLSVDLPELPAIYVEGNGPALEQLFLNLLLNAAQATPLGGRVSVSVRIDDHVVEAAIRDTGGGIPPEQLARVFEPFFTTRSDGTGLGLAIARGIAAAHRGELTLDSTPNAGTVARVRIPILRRGDGRATGEWPAREQIEPANRNEATPAT
jgi:signal transduction histidine kinase